MNAQQLINETPTTNFNFGVFWKKTREALQSPINLPTKGDKFVARKGNNQYPQDVSEGSNTFYLSESNTSLKPRTFNYTKKQEAINNLEAQKVLKDLGIEVL